MALVKSSDIAFELPVATVTAKGKRWLCRNLDHLTLIPSIQLQDERFLGMKITDASGRRWVVRSIRKIGRAERWTIFHVIFFSPPDWRVDFMLEQLPPVAPRGRGSRQGSKKRLSDHDGTQSDGNGLESPVDNPPEQIFGDFPGRDDAGPAVRATASGASAALVMASDIDLEYPLVGFTQKEGALKFGDAQTLTTCALTYVRDKTLLGMELIDNRLRRWIVRSLRPEHPLPIRRWWHLSLPNVTFDLELEEIEPMDLNELKRRLLDDWELEDFEDEKAVRRAPTLAAMLKAGYQQATGLL